MAPVARPPRRAARRAASSSRPAVVGDDVARARRGHARPARCCCSRTAASSRARRRTTRSWPRALAALADLYVNDAFGAAHRAHATTEGVAHLLPAYAGLLLEREVEELTARSRRSRAPAGRRPRRRQGLGQDRRPRALPRDRRPVLIGGAMCFASSAPRASRPATRWSRRRGSSMAGAPARGARARPASCPSRPRPRRLVQRRRGAAGGRRRRGARRLDGARHRPADGARVRRGDRRRRDRVSGTGRWARSSWSRSPPEPAPSPRRSPRLRDTRWSAAATRPRRWPRSASPTGRLALDRRRRLARAPGGQGAARRGGAGGG